MESTIIRKSGRSSKPSGKSLKAPVKKRRRKGAVLKKDVASGYNRFKEYNGQLYTGMAVGRSHKWYYDKGVWKDRKITPERWEISYDVVKRRAGKAPEGSGAAVGTEYHWFIIAHQMVKKLDANSYSTSLNGFKFKIAHKRASTGTWSISGKGSRKKVMKILELMMHETAAMEEE